MPDRSSPTLASLPSVDRVLRSPWAADLIELYGRTPVTAAVRAVLSEVRAHGHAEAVPAGIDDSILRARVGDRLEEMSRPSLRQVFNLTGTVVHTNLGRARLAPAATRALALAAVRPSNLEFDLAAGARGDRDVHVEAQLCKLTGAEAATVVNNNAAAVVLVLNTLARGKEVPTSRGELIEIGGAFRMPEIMACSGCVLREVGTTNRVHLDDYARAIGPATGVVMKVHTSNYAVVGFTSSVAEADLAALCRERGVPFVVDLGSGSLVDLRQYGLPHEPMPSEALGRGADIVTFSGDKLLGGPQAGILVGRADLIAAIKRNPMKRALRVDKMTIAALSATLALYEDPDRLPARLPVLAALPPSGTGGSAASARGHPRRRTSAEGDGGDGDARHRDRRCRRLREPDRQRRPADADDPERRPRHPADRRARIGIRAEPDCQGVPRPAGAGHRPRSRRRLHPRFPLPR
jgi:L-seryl-tRNA(Ser) seleniumtransferase